LFQLIEVSDGRWIPNGSNDARERLDAMSDLLEQWRDPVFHDRHKQVPAELALRLTQNGPRKSTAATSTTSGCTFLLAVAGIRQDHQPNDLPARRPTIRRPKSNSAPCSASFHQGCQLEDVALASQLPERADPL